NHSPQYLLGSEYVPGINSSTWRYVRIELRTNANADSVYVYWGSTPEDLTPQLIWTAPPGTLDMTYDGIGFSSSTGWGYSEHQIDDVRITSYINEQPQEPDTTPPSMELLGPSYMIVERGAFYEEPGVTVTDDVYHQLQAVTIGE